AAALGDFEPAFDPYRGAAAARARPPHLRLAARRARVPRSDRPAAPDAVLEPECGRGGGRRTLRSRWVGVPGMGAAAGHARAHARGRLSGAAVLPHRARA